MSTAIKIENVSKQYRLGVISTGTLSHDLNRWWTTKILRKEDPYLKIGSVNDRSQKADSEYVWALKDINMEIEQGDVVGIIGKNGAGKSTLLKLLSRVTKPTTGSIKYKGRIASLLEVGTGFHPEMTGRENIYMNGAIMGMTKQEITRKLDEIVDFSGCERYIDTPVKRYSSGMTVRLGFAIAAHLDPEILVVDEVLAVGDAEFQKKAIGKMQDVSRGEGRTVLFVSHNMASIRALCRTGVVLENGYVSMIDDVEACVDYYLQNQDSIVFNSSIITEDHRRKLFRTKEFEYVEVSMLNNPNEIATEEPLEFVLKVKRNSHKYKKLQVGILINNQYGVRVGVCDTSEVDVPDLDEFVVKVEFFDHQLAKGFYTLDFALNIHDYISGYKAFDAVYNVVGFEVSHVDIEHKQLIVSWPSRNGNCSYQHSNIKVIG